MLMAKRDVVGSSHASHSARSADRCRRDRRQRVFVQRDYAAGARPVRFDTRLPEALSGRVGPRMFERVVEGVNARLAVAEESSNCAVCCEGLLGCLTGYAVFLCMDTHYEKVLHNVAEFIEDQVGGKAILI